MKELQNPKTEVYFNLKNHFISKWFPWYYHKSTLPEGSEVDDGHDEFPFFSYEILTRPGCNGDLYSKVNGPEFIDDVNSFFSEVCFFNGIDPKTILRINVNLTIPTEKNLPSPLHTDHNFPHKNMLVYITPTHDGHTIVDGIEHPMDEDSILIFDGSLLHCHLPPTTDRRIVLVITYID